MITILVEFVYVNILNQKMLQNTVIYKITLRQTTYSTNSSHEHPLDVILFAKKRSKDVPATYNVRTMNVQ